MMLKPSEVKTRAEQLEGENQKFRRYLKNRADADELDAQFLMLHKELFSDYDCCKCNNCCKTYLVYPGDSEITIIADFLGQTEKDFINEYLCLDKDEDGTEAYRLKGKPCVFLDGDGRCRIHSCKPIECKDYPYTDKPERLWSLYSVISKAETCPVVFEILQRLKVLYGFRSMYTP